MKAETVKAMIEEAKKNGIADIRYSGIDGHGLASSGSSVVSVFLTRYPDTDDGEESDRFAECLKSVDRKLKPTDYLDSVEVLDGFVKVTLNHLVCIESKNKRKGDLECTYRYRNFRGNDETATRTYRRACLFRDHFSYRCEWTEYGGELLRTILIPFENIIAICC